jgi:hypothetical protein
MIQIGNVVVSFDTLRAKFICDLNACKGACCVEGDAGAPVALEEVAELEAALPVVWDMLTPEARGVIERQGVVYTDSEGDLVTSIVGGKDCVFTHHEPDGCCHCAIEKAYFDGKLKFRKPVSCHLYPLRVKDFGGFQGVNYHRWDICRAAEVLGQHKGTPLYQYLREPLIRKFGEEWYQELEEVVEELKKQGML